MNSLYTQFNKIEQAIADLEWELPKIAAYDTEMRRLHLERKRLLKLIIKALKGV
jgi:hypothetical protein